MTVKKITSIGLMTAFLCIVAPWAIHIGPIPITIATFGVYLISVLLSTRYAVMSVIIYCFRMLQRLLLKVRMITLKKRRFQPHKHSLYTG